MSHTRPAYRPTWQELEAAVLLRDKQVARLKHKLAIYAAQVRTKEFTNHYLRLAIMRLRPQVVGRVPGMTPAEHCRQLVVSLIGKSAPEAGGLSIAGDLECQSCRQGDQSRVHSKKH